MLCRLAFKLNWIFFFCSRCEARVPSPFPLWRADDLCVVYWTVHLLLLLGSATPAIYLLPTRTRVCFQALYSVPFATLSVPTAGLMRLQYLRFITSLDIWGARLNTLLFFVCALALLGPWHFHLCSRIRLSASTHTHIHISPLVCWSELHLGYH